MKGIRKMVRKNIVWKHTFLKSWWLFPGIILSIVQVLGAISPIQSLD
jgi:hypothetical protein